MFLMKYKSSTEKIIEPPAQKPVKKTKEKKQSPKKSKVKNDSNIFFEMDKSKEIITEDKKMSKQPEHLRLALEARRARLAEEKNQGTKEKKPKKKQKKDEKSDSESSLDINKLKLKKTPKKYFSNTDSD
jgi:hypothetical protein